MFNSELGTREPDSKTLIPSDTREPVGQVDSIQNSHLIQFNPWPGVGAPGGGCGERGPLKKRGVQGVEFPNIKKNSEFQYKIDHISKTENRNKKSHEQKNPLQNIAHLLERLAIGY